MAECLVDMEKSSIVYNWKIEKFDDWLKLYSDLNRKLVLNSSKFSTADGRNKNTWFLQLQMQPSECELDDSILCPIVAFFINCESCEKFPVTATINMWIIDQEMKKRKSLSAHTTQTFAGTDNTKKCFSAVFVEDDWARLLVKNVLTVQCELTVKQANTATLIPAPSTSEEHEKMNEIMKTDLVIVVGDEKFKVHKAVLSARSPVFSAMFDDVIEQKNNEVHIDDIEADVFQQLLRYIYSDQEPNPQDISIDLLIAADKYDLEKLKVVCEFALCDAITNVNAVSLLIHAERLGAKLLVERVVSFIIARPCLLDTGDFKDLELLYPHLLSTLLREAMIKLNKLLEY